MKEAVSVDEGQCGARIVTSGWLLPGRLSAPHEPPSMSLCSCVSCCLHPAGDHFLFCLLALSTDHFCCRKCALCIKAYASSSLINEKTDPPRPQACTQMNFWQKRLFNNGRLLCYWSTLSRSLTLCKSCKWSSPILIYLEIWIPTCMYTRSEAADSHR